MVKNTFSAIDRVEIQWNIIPEPLIILKWILWESENGGMSLLHENELSTTITIFPCVLPVLSRNEGVVPFMELLSRSMVYSFLLKLRQVGLILRPWSRSDLESHWPHRWSVHWIMPSDERFLWFGWDWIASRIDVWLPVVLFIGSLQFSQRIYRLSIFDIYFAHSQIPFFSAGFYKLLEQAGSKPRSPSWHSAAPFSSILLPIPVLTQSSCLHHQAPLRVFQEPESGESG